MPEPVPKPILEAKKRRVISIRLIISLTAVVLITLSVVGVGWVAERKTREALTSELEHRLLLEARNLSVLAAEAMLAEFPELTLCPVVAEMQEGRPDLACVVVLDQDGIIQGHADMRALGERFTLMDTLRPVSTTQELAPGESILGDAERLIAVVPAYQANGKTLTTAVVGLHRSYLESIITSSRMTLVLVSAGLLAVGIAATLIMMSLLLRPIGVLRKGLVRIGQGDLETPLPDQDRTELGLLAETVNAMAAQLRRSQEEMLEKERLAHEMDLAHSIQQSLLPEGATKVGEFVIEGAYQSAAEVGGDYYDVFPLQGGKTGLVIADVSGKGLGGCMVTSMLAALVKSLRGSYNSPKNLLIALEENLDDSLGPGTFVTMFYGILDPSQNHLTFASAAHSPLMVYRAKTGEVETLRTKGIPLGAIKGGALRNTLEDSSIDFERGDLALQFTDGLNEAWNRSRKEDFGFERIQNVLVQTANQGARNVVSRLQREVSTWSAPLPPGDDQTLLVISREGKPEHQAPLPERTPVTAYRAISPKRQLEEMLGDSWNLNLPIDLQKLNALRNWIESCPGLRDQNSHDKHLIESSLYELCANIIEHGFKNQPEQPIDIWWLPQGSILPMYEGPGVPAIPGLANPDPSDNLGFFLICDQGLAFDPRGLSPPDLSNPETRKRGRGLGLQIINSSMAKVMYLPRTPAGNLTLLRFDPNHPKIGKGACHV